MKTKQTEQKEIGRIKLSDNQDLVASLVDNEKLDLRIFVNNDSYTGATKRGFRFYLFDNNWIEFKKLTDKVDKAYEEIGRGNERNKRREERYHWRITER